MKRQEEVKGNVRITYLQLKLFGIPLSKKFKVQRFERLPDGGVRFSYHAGKVKREGILSADNKTIGDWTFFVYDRAQKKFLIETIKHYDEKGERIGQTFFEKGVKIKADFFGNGIYELYENGCLKKREIDRDDEEINEYFSISTGKCIKREIFKPNGKRISQYNENGDLVRELVDKKTSIPGVHLIERFNHKTGRIYHISRQQPEVAFTDKKEMLKVYRDMVIFYKTKDNERQKLLSLVRACNNLTLAKVIVRNHLSNENED